MWTPHPVPPDTYPVLFADEYGYQAGNLLWRGRFEGGNGTAGPSAVYLRVIGGAGSGFSAYLNGVLLGSYLGEHGVKDGNMTLTFHNATIKSGAENVLLVIQDTMGKDQREGALDPRGILNATLVSSTGEALNFTCWKVAGNAGGNHLIDPVRGTWNEGGLYAERLGWHLPGFDDGEWESGRPGDGFSGSGVKFYRTNLTLDMPKDHDVSLALELLTEGRPKLRAQLYVNGYQFGKIIPWFGNQVEFPGERFPRQMNPLEMMLMDVFAVFPGILNYHGDNTIGLSMWSMSEEHAAVDVQVKALGVHRSALDLSFDSEYLRPGWSDRSQYA